VKELMNRTAADNAYMHKDFHGALSRALIYLQNRFGDDMRQFVTAFYAPLSEDIRTRGLAALKEHYAAIYAMEGGKAEFTLSADGMLMTTDANPAVVYMRQNGHTAAPLFSETVKTVLETICEGTPYAAQILSYDEATGASVVRFARRQA
jgi:hypothetical protein